MIDSIISIYIDIYIKIEPKKSSISNNMGFYNSKTKSK